MDLECTICFNLLSEGPDLTTQAVEEPPAKRGRGRPRKQPNTVTSTASPSSNGNAAELCVIPCGHPFHKICIIDWVKKKQECPICSKRSTLRDLVPLFLPTSAENKLCRKCKDTESQISALKHEIVQLKVRIEANPYESEDETKINDMQQQNNKLMTELADVKNKYEEELRENEKLKDEIRILVAAILD